MWAERAPLTRALCARLTYRRRARSTIIVERALRRRPRATWQRKKQKIG